MPLVSLVAQDSGLTLHQVVYSIPHDAAAFVVYVLLAGFIYFIWRGSRKPDGHVEDKHV